MNRADRYQIPAKKGNIGWPIYIGRYISVKYSDIYRSSMDPSNIAMTAVFHFEKRDTLIAKTVQCSMSVSDIYKWENSEMQHIGYRFFLVDRVDRYRALRLNQSLMFWGSKGT